jgi:hypothetical protein
MRDELRKELPNALGARGLKSGYFCNLFSYKSLRKMNNGTSPFLIGGLMTGLIYS